MKFSHIIILSAVLFCLPNTINTISKSRIRQIQSRQQPKLDDSTNSSDYDCHKPTKSLPPRRTSKRAQKITPVQTSRTLDCSPIIACTIGAAVVLTITLMLETGEFKNFYCGNYNKSK